MDDILKVTGLNKSYDNFSLKDVSFTLPEGCITGFIGVNGAGKTTTLRSILGLTSRISGHINFFGMDIEKDARKIKDRIGVVLDDGCFYDELSLAEMKDVIASAYSAWSERDFKEYMERFELSPKQKINTLSKGIKMKYALGTIISIKTPNPQNSKFRNLKWATFSYKVRGKTYQSQNRIQVPMTSQVGTTISVRYDINHPEKLYSFSVSRIVVSFLIAVVCAALAMSNFM